MDTASKFNGASGRIAFVQARWHEEIVDRARVGFAGEIAALDFDDDQVDYFTVPGAFELPLHAQRLAESGRYAAVVCAALVVDGGIYRHEFVASTVLDGLMRVQLDTGVPVCSVVLAPHHFQVRPEHVEFFGRHFVEKGVEAARACAVTVASLTALQLQPVAGGAADM
ncbi:6,7-dimethyl-8-ribityllumazine synthase [Rhodococcus erythropolis]|uniref:6,7-dimethyl-8-ribityllumazine synthase n=1 Tax=Rhodococcus erythropolis TaxID=1833 RepID=UPI0029498AEA|nr:6,7-dimethyl-8-ribityllumazine synthase [Rhodococcus erythropolis]MDV6278229.1 6,7-dimethyl-8-ribityllumazine synthase [Rhodococcus erythropolis]